MKNLSHAEILELSPAERILLAEDIWDSLTEIPQSIQLTEDQKEELDKRLEAYHRSPEQGSPWHIVRDRIRQDT